VEEHCYTEDTKYDVDFPADVLKAGRNKIGLNESRVVSTNIPLRIMARAKGEKCN